MAQSATKAPKAPKVSAKDAMARKNAAVRSRWLAEPVATKSAGPTPETYEACQQAYDFFNVRLFATTLPGCLITLQRKNRTFGYFSADKFGSTAGAVTDEIALHPGHFLGRTVRETLSTLVHEMVHQKQHHFGTPGRGRYHNAQWALMMQDVGLHPSTTGEPGGKQTGQKVTHYILDDGPFERHCQDLLATGYALSWGDRDAHEHHKGPPSKSGNRTKFTCPACGLNAWARAEALLACVECQVTLEAEAA